MRSFIIAFSMYSRIPMPKVEWNEKSMRYSMCFFPFVGLVLGGCSAGLFYGLDFLGAGMFLKAILLGVLPIILTGGIHMDGFLDTVDAKSSWKPAEERLRILKDPHLGAFACIYGIVYLLAAVGFFSRITEGEIGCVAAGYFFSRSLSGLSIVTFRKAKKDGMAAASAEASPKGVKWILLGEAAAGAVLMIWMAPLAGGCCAAAALLVFWYYRCMAYRCFGGVTGDLAGYFLQLCELAILAAAVLVSLAEGVMPV